MYSLMVVLKYLNRDLPAGLPIGETCLRHARTPVITGILSPTQGKADVHSKAIPVRLMVGIFSQNRKMPVKTGSFAIYYMTKHATKMAI
tara:strand:- start:33516 stop:33782 length:267 start_codon:yes stop_codon:yes gene_type:complete